MSQDLSLMRPLDQSLFWAFLILSTTFWTSLRVGVLARVEGRLVRFSVCLSLPSIERSHLSIAEPLHEIAVSLEAIVLLR